MIAKEKKTTHIYNYKSMRMLIDDFAKYGSIEFKGVEKGRMEAIDALVYLMHRYNMLKDVLETLVWIKNKK